MSKNWYISSCLHNPEIACNFYSSSPRATPRFYLFLTNWLASGMFWDGADVSPPGIPLLNTHASEHRAPVLPHLWDGHLLTHSGCFYSNQNAMLRTQFSILLINNHFYKHSLSPGWARGIVNKGELTSPSSSTYTPQGIFKF